MRRRYASSYNPTSEFVTDQYSVHDQRISFLSSPFLPLLLLSPLSEFISPLDLLKVVQFIVERTFSPFFPVRTSACRLTIEEKTF